MTQLPCLIVKLNKYYVDTNVLGTNHINVGNQKGISLTILNKYNFI